MSRPPVVGYSGNPLAGVQRAAAVEPGTTIRDHAPPETGGVVCHYNGEIVLRADWELVLEDGDVVAFVDYPQGREGLRTLLMVAAVAVTVFAPYLASIGYGWVTTAVVVANLAYNFLVPPRVAAQEQLAGPDPVFSTSLDGNAARLDQPIWRNCGRAKITPPFAAQPYLEFALKNPGEPNGESDQYFYALFAVGVGNHEVEKVFIGKTAISHFQDVVVAQYLPPGTPPSQVNSNVVSSAEVTAALDMPEGRYVGPYAACRPNDRVEAVGVDVMAPQGLGIGTSPLTVEWQVEVREINDLGGTPVGPWQVLGSETRTAANNTPLRWSFKYTLSTPIRCEVRVVRTNNKNSDPNARDGVSWIGLRGYKEADAPLNPQVAHFEVVMRASEQLSQVSQRDFSMIVRALVRTWDPVNGWSVGESFTRNAAWWLADLWTNPYWGEGLPDERVDLQGLYDWAGVLDSRQDHFDFTFATSQDAWTAAQLIASSGRARAFRKNGIRTVARDALVDLPYWAFTPRNTQPRSMTLHSKAAMREQADGVVVQYRSNVTWDTELIECPCPGVTYSSPSAAASLDYESDLPPMSNPVYITLDGVTGSKHAEREGLYQAADLAYRRATVSAVTEMEGTIVSFFDPVAWQPEAVGYGQSGDVAFWDEVTLVMGLSEPPDWSRYPLFLRLVRDDLTLTEPVAVLPGPTANDVVLPAAPDFDLVLDDGGRERPKFLLGPRDGADELVKLTGVSDAGPAEGGAQLYSLSGLVDDERVHLRDNPLLPGPGEVQDPIDDGTDTPDEEGLVMVRMVDTWLYAGNSVALGLGADGGGTGASLTFNTDGTAEVLVEPFGIWNTWTLGSGMGFFTEGTTDLANQWMRFPVEESAAALYEIRAIDVYGRGWFHGDPLDTWLPMTSSHNWFVSVSETPPPLDRSDALLRVQVRLIGEAAAQGSANYVFNISIDDLSP